MYEVFHLHKFLFLFLTKFNKLVLNHIYQSVFCILCCGISSFQCSSLYVWFSVIFLLCIKFQLLKSDCLICLNESHIKMMKNTFYFILKVFPVLTVFKFLSRLFDHVKNGLIGKVNIKFYYVTTCEINNYKIHIGQYLSFRSKGNQTKKFGQLIRFKVRNIFLQKSYRK